MSECASREVAEVAHFLMWFYGGAEFIVAMIAVILLVVVLKK